MFLCAFSIKTVREEMKMLRLHFFYSKINRRSYLFVQHFDQQTFAMLAKNQYAVSRNIASKQIMAK